MGRDALIARVNKRLWIVFPGEGSRHTYFKGTEDEFRDWIKRRPNPWLEEEKKDYVDVK